MTPAPLWTKREVAQYLAVSTRQVDKIVAARNLPFVVIGGRRRFRVDDILFYIASRSFGHRSNPSIPASTI